MKWTNYYPYGLTMAGISSKEAGKPENRFKYNGKKLQHKEFSDGTGLEWYDYGAWMQDPQLGRFNALDRFAEKYYSFTPFQYTANNPIRFLDANGHLSVLPKETGIQNFIIIAVCLIPIFVLKALVVRKSDLH